MQVRKSKFYALPPRAGVKTHSTKDINGGHGLPWLIGKKFMFRVISIVGISFAVVMAIVAFLGSRKGKVSSVIDKDHWLIWIVKKLTLLVGVLSGLVLILTGFGPRLVCGVQIYGYLLMLHATAAPVFMMCVAAAILLWADSAKMSRPCQCLVEKLKGTELEGTATGVCYAKRVGFWVIAILMIPVILSIILSMVPLFGTHMQEVLFEIHRWCALLLAMTIIVEVGLARK